MFTTREGSFCSFTEVVQMHLNPVRQQRDTGFIRSHNRAELPFITQCSNAIVRVQFRGAVLVSCPRPVLCGPLPTTSTTVVVHLSTWDCEKWTSASGLSYCQICTQTSCSPFTRVHLACIFDWWKCMTFSPTDTTADVQILIQLNYIRTACTRLNCFKFDTLLPAV